ncbi:MAG: mechanosensitive ion channel family protein [Pseudomonadota bacterium]|nr:mechanosensitive ion channel family protein [Pseudomonadota bacterium]
MPENLRVFFSTGSGEQLKIWLIPIVIFLFLFPLLLFLHRFFWKRVRQFASHTNATWDDLVLDAVHSPTRILAIALAVSVSLQTAPVVLRSHPFCRFGTKIGLILIGVWILDRVFSALIRSDFLPMTLSHSTRVLILAITRLTFLSTSVLVVLDTLGISITPILASLGIGSLAVALAMQDTLNNFFSGLYLLVDRPIRIGDFIKLEDGTEGFVRKVGWRSTQIEMITENLVVIPNSKVASSQLTNYDLPLKDTMVLVPLGVSYGCDLQKVERVTVEVADQILKQIPGGDSSFTPVIRYNSFADSSINFNVVLRAHHRTDQQLLIHEFIKALHVRFNSENIEIPFPQRVVHSART